MRTMSRILLVAGIAVLALALPASAMAQGTISVQGSVTQLVPNDAAKFAFSVSLERSTRAAALRVTSRHLRRVIAAVQGTAGVGPGDVSTGTISVREVDLATSGDKHRRAFRARQTIQVTLHKADNAGQLASAALAAGATGLSGPDFFVGDSDDAYDNALVAAFDEAKAKAQALATSAGGTLGPALSIEEGGGVSPVQGAPLSAGAGCATTATPIASGTAARACTKAPPVKPGRSKVKATVRVVFELD